MAESFPSRIADKVATIAGSWRFIIAQSTFIIGWMLWNTINGGTHFDPYPFILLNLCIGFQAAYTGPFVLMSQSRQDAKDHDLAERIYALEEKIEQRDEKILSMLQLVAYGGPPHVGIHRRTLQQSREEQSPDSP